MRIAFNVQELLVMNDKSRDELCIDIEVDVREVLEAINKCMTCEKDKEPIHPAMLECQKCRKKHY